MRITSGLTTKRSLIMVTMLVVVALTCVAGPASATDAGTLATAPVKDAGIALDYPSAWTKVPYTKAAIRKGVARLAKENPNLAKRLDEAAQTALLEGVKFAAMDLEGDAFRDNVVVQSVDEEFPSASEISMMRGAFESAGFVVLRTSSAKVGKYAAYRFDLTRSINAPDGTRVSLRLTELLVPNGDATTVLAVSTRADDAGEAVIESMMQSVRRI